MWGDHGIIVASPPHGEIPWVSHDTYPGVDIGIGVKDMYVVYSLCVLTSVACLVEGCPEMSHKPRRLKEHCMYIYQKSKISIL